MGVLAIIFKVSEVCPLGCKYCYFFKGKSDLSKHPPIVSKETVQKLCASLENLAVEPLEDRVDGLDIILHGGEPLVLGVNFLNWICQYIKDTVGKIFKVRFSLQTNGILLDETWISFFREYKVRVGISIDGPEDIHNRHRIYKDGRGSYGDVVKAIQLAVKSNITFGTLSVINPENNPKEIYHHLRNLGVESMHFLLQDFCYEQLPSWPLSKCGEFLCALFDEWIKEDNPNVDIRLFSSIIEVLIGKRAKFFYTKEDIEAVTVFSNGDLSPADDYCLIGDEIMSTGYNLDNASLPMLFASKSLQKIKKAKNLLPKDCKQCRWKKGCLGGFVFHRYSKKKGFSQKTVYCKALSALYSHIEEFLIHQGISQRKINEVLQAN